MEGGRKGWTESGRDGRRKAMRDEGKGSKGRVRAKEEGVYTYMYMYISTAVRKRFQTRSRVC